MVDLKVDNVVFCCDLGRCPQNNVGVSSSCDITNNLCLFSDGPVRERTLKGIASDRGDVITKQVQTNPPTLNFHNLASSTMYKERFFERIVQFKERNKS